MATNPNGWLPYGSADDSIVFQHSLKTALTSSDITDLGTTLNIGSSALTWDAYGSVLHGHDVTHNSDYGMKSVSDVDGATECGYRIDGVGTKLDDCGQISFEVERAFLCEDNSTYYSSGYAPSAMQAMMSCSPTTGSAGVIGAKGTNEQFYASGAILAGLASYGQSAGKSDFVTVNFGWSGGRVGGICYMAIDGVVIDSASRNAATLAGAFATFYIGSDRGIATTFPTGHYIRNLQISTRPPMFAVHPLLRHVGMISDSILNSDDVVNGNYRDVVSSWQFRRELAKKGLYCGTITVTTDGGARLDNSVDGGTTDYIRTQLTTLLALKPTVVIIRGGTNDAQGSRCSQSTWQAAVTDYITDCMAVSSVRRVIFLGIPSAVGSTAGNSAAVQAQRATGDTKIQAACDAWRAANPTDTRDVIFANDIYNRLGGETPSAGTFIGQVAGTYADLHLSGYGHYLHGKAIADWVIKELGTA